MRLKLVLGVIGLCTFAPGCRLAQDATHYLAVETCLFSDEVRSAHLYRRLARAAWHEYHSAYPGQIDNEDFADGFRAGYADYLEAGEDCCSPRLPPFKYWKTRYQTPEGRAAIELWFAGFKEGAAAAKISGYRDLVILPVNECDPSPPGSQYPGSVGPPLGAPVPPPTMPAPEPVGELHAPRSVSPQADPPQAGPVTPRR